MRLCNVIRLLALTDCSSLSLQPSCLGADHRASRKPENMWQVAVSLEVVTVLMVSISKQLSKSRMIEILHNLVRWVLSYAMMGYTRL